MDKAGTIACKDLSASMKSAKYRHKDTNRRLHGWVKVMADTFTSISRRRGSALALVNSACTSQIDSRTGLLQGARRRNRFYRSDRVVLDAATNAACNIPARLYDEEITLYMPYREVRALLAERTRTVVGTARPGLGLRGHATPSHQPRAKYHEPARFEEQCRSFGIHGGFVHIGAVPVSGIKSQASRKRACRLRARSPQSMTRSS